MAHGGALDVALHAGKLAGKEQRLVAASDLHGGFEHPIGGEVSIAVHNPHADEVGSLQTGDGPEDPLLLSPLQARLEADHVEETALGIVLAELHDGVGLSAGARVRQPDRLHRAKAQGFGAASGYRLDRQTALEVHVLLEVLYRGELGGCQVLDKGVVLLLAHGTVEVGRLIEVERLTGEGLYLLYQSVRGKRTGGDNARSLRYRCNLSADHLYIRVVVHRLRDGSGEVFPSDPQSAARRNPVRVGAAQDHGSQTPQLLFK